MLDKNSKILMLVESPTKVHKIKDILKELGYKKAVVMATVGHTTEIANDGTSYYNTGIWPEQNFKVKTVIAEDKQKIVMGIKAAAREAEVIIIASDPDREGENLGNHIKELIGRKEEEYYRVKYHSITKEEIKAALEHPGKMDMNLVNAAETRQIVDKIIGYRLSPIAKTYVGAKSVGRCQSVGLKIIVDREKEIQNFVPENYFDLYVAFKKNKTEFKAKYIGTSAQEISKIKTKAEVDAIKAQCTGKFIIQNIDKKERQESPKPPFTTLNFQQEVANRLNLSVKDAMSCAQSLFENGRISYHRTDDDTISPEFLPVLEEYIKNTFGTSVYNKPRVGKKTGDEQAGHECLRITDPTMTPEEFNKAETNTLLQKVYKIIWQRTIAACLPNAVYSETNYIIENNGHKFSLVSKELLNEGYKKVYSYADDNDEAGEIVKETFIVNEELKNPTLNEEARTIKPPTRYTEATLVKQLQKTGTGRPSTTATIVETVLSSTRGYAEKDGKSIVPTERGMQLSAFLDRAFSNIIRLDYTREMEESLDKIANGELTKLEFLNNFYNNLEETIANNTEAKMPTAEQVCPECGAPMVVRRSKYGKLFLGCSTFPRCRGIVNMK